ncbi:flagellar protein FlaG [Halotalea alkalilenta]|uniref:flagellar protein FlaG n=1 Tax=Halotalea alkalilenta TaxID=376489 RepID=UPI000487F66F|nr:flagellar protein FlaG [Halotalea alkalilenta]
MTLPPIPPIPPQSTQLPSAALQAATDLITAASLKVEAPQAERTSPDVEREMEPQAPLNALEVAQQAFADLGVTFEIDEGSDRLIIKVVDRSSGELIRQIPSEEMLRIATRLETGSVTPGSLLDEWA